MEAQRPSWDEFFILLALFYSTRGSCDRLRTACVLVNENHQLISAGYNGSVSGLKSCDEAGHLIIDNHCLRTIHGELNAIFNARESLNGATAYVIGTPCLNCIKDLLQKGIKRIVYVGSYENAAGSEHIHLFCEEKSVELRQWTASVAGVFEIIEKAAGRLNGAGGLFEKQNLVLKLK